MAPGHVQGGVGRAARRGDGVVLQPAHLVGHRLQRATRHARAQVKGLRLLGRRMHRVRRIGPPALPRIRADLRQPLGLGLGRRAQPRRQDRTGRPQGGRPQRRRIAFDPPSPHSAAACAAPSACRPCAASAPLRSTPNEGRL
ncbi:hypothetical protein XthCFBP4691_04575 [Xanthomonas theicola]|uniref:Uncharacterized protein n=1 Tax=Xanthomonas theicola TaxID=56464 RepID=A0A2S6ZJA2_9XANT|nr:hypothetical protein XthCFBP4691_04575 [Xanthomonas theicola]